VTLLFHVRKTSRHNGVFLFSFLNLKSSKRWPPDAENNIRINIVASVKIAETILINFSSIFTCTSFGRLGKMPKFKEIRFENEITRGDGELVFVFFFCSESGEIIIFDLRDISKRGIFKSFKSLDTV